MTHIVVEDTELLVPVGTIITEADAIKNAAHKSLTMMPLIEHLYLDGGVAGFVKREFGEGVRLNPQTPGPVVKLAMYISPQHGRIHWRARISATPGIEDKCIAMGGGLRLTSDTSQGIPACSVSSLGHDAMFNFNRLSVESMDDEGWVIGGQMRVNSQMDGVFGFSLYGNGHGFRLVWAALSQSD